MAVDHGKEFYLTLYIQEKLSQHRHNINRPPYVQTASSKVNFVLLTTDVSDFYSLVYSISGENSFYLPKCSFLT